MIHLLVPGLLGPFPRFAEAGEAPRLPALELLLARGERGTGGESFSEVAFELFGVKGDPKATAPLCHLADAGVHSEMRWLLHAHPLYLVPDQDRLLAVDFHDRAIPAAEAARFAEAFNRHFADDDIELLVPHPDRWYLATEREPGVRLAPLGDILGRNIDHFLPEGERAAYWRSLLNETQMLFHGLPVNDERQTRGELTISGLWFSGAGDLPVVPGGRLGGIEWWGEASPTLPAGGEGEAVATACGGGWEGEAHALLSGLVRCAETPGDAPLLIDLAPGRAVLDGDFTSWCQALERFDDHLSRLLDIPLILYDAAGHTWRWQPAMRRRFWRRLRRLVPE